MRLSNLTRTVLALITLGVGILIYSACIATVVGSPDIRANRAALEAAMEAGR
jgi:hypothetical protein